MAKKYFHKQVCIIKSLERLSKFKELGFSLEHSKHFSAPHVTAPGPQEKLPKAKKNTGKTSRSKSASPSSLTGVANNIQH